MDFVSKHIPSKMKRLSLFSNDKHYENKNGNKTTKEEYSLDRSLSYKRRVTVDVPMRDSSFCTFHRGNQVAQKPQIPNDEISSNVESIILKAKAQAKTVSVVDGNLYIDYQYVCPLPPGLRI